MTDEITEKLREEVAALRKEVADLRAWCETVREVLTKPAPYPLSDGSVAYYVHYAERLLECMKR